jgi:hypothetical protein
MASGSGSFEQTLDTDDSSEGYGEEPLLPPAERIAPNAEMVAAQRPGFETRAGNWCSCGNCDVARNLPEVECLCCRDDGERYNSGDKIRSLLTEPTPAAVHQPLTCITQHQCFYAFCMYRRGLMNAAHQYRADYGPHSLKFKNENRLLRYLAYREFTRWVHGYCGKHVRKTIPACAVLAIRTAFPKADNETYEGFHYADDYDPAME